MTRLTWLAEAARLTGMPVVEVDGWQTRDYDNQGMDVTPTGVIYHHTAGKKNADTALDYPSLITVRDGRSDLPGPLAHYGVGFTGTIYVIASGKANHAGLGSWPGIPYTGGSRALIGIEVEHPGLSVEPWPWDQRVAVRRLVASIASWLGYTGVGDTTADGLVMLGHKEWAANPPGFPGRKIDPISTDLDAERALMDTLAKMEAQMLTQADYDNIAEAVEAKLRVTGVKVERSSFNAQTFYSDTIGEADKTPTGDSIGADVRRILDAVTD